MPDARVPAAGTVESYAGRRSIELTAMELERNRELFDYYAMRQPDRSVYLYDRASRQMTRLGNVVELSRRFPVTAPTRS